MSRIQIVDVIWGKDWEKKQVSLCLLVEYTHYKRDMTATAGT